MTARKGCFMGQASVIKREHIENIGTICADTELVRFVICTISAEDDASRMATDNGDLCLENEITKVCRFGITGGKVVRFRLSVVSIPRESAIGIGLRVVIPTVVVWARQGIIKIGCSMCCLVIESLGIGRL